MPSGPDVGNLPNTDEGFLGLFTRHAASQPDRTFVRIGARALTFGQLESSVAGLVAWLRHQGVGSGDRVALMLRNGEAALSLMLAVAYAGAIWVPVHTGAVGDNLAYVLGHAEPRIVVAEPDLLPAIAACVTWRKRALVRRMAMAGFAAIISASSRVLPITWSGRSTR